MENKVLIPAVVDGKNVATDWIEDMFDDYTCIINPYNDGEVVGFVKGHIVSVTFNSSSNKIVWNVMDGSGFEALKERLMADDYDYDGLICSYEEYHNLLIQSSYFK